MNQEIARTSLMVFLLCVGLYQVLIGTKLVRRPRESSFWGWVHVAVGAVLLLLPIPLIFWLKIFRSS